MFSGLQFVSEEIYFGLATLVGEKSRKPTLGSEQQGIIRSPQTSFVIINKFCSSQGCTLRGRTDNALGESHFKL